MTRHFLASAALAGAIALGLSACNRAPTEPAATDTAAALAAQQAQAAAAPGSTVPSYPGTKLNTTLDGHGEIPGPGDPKGNGEATVWVDTHLNQVCYILGIGGIDAPTMAHIHKGAPGVAGDVVVVLDNPATMRSESCAKVDPALAADLAANPANYYVNVHDAAHPKGAIRGQLKAM